MQGKLKLDKGLGAESKLEVCKQWRRVGHPRLETATKLLRPTVSEPRCVDTPPETWAAQGLGQVRTVG